MTNFLAKSLEAFSSRQGDQVVGDHGKRPVCLNALPGAHEHLPEGQMLLDLLVKDLDPEPLLVQSHGLGLGHRQIVRDQKFGFGTSSFGNKERYHPDLGQKNDQLGHLEPLLSGGAYGLVLSRSLGQVTDDLFDAVDLHITVPFDGCDVNPSRSRNKIENRSAGIPTVYKGNEGCADLFAERSQNFFCQIDLASESTLGARSLRPIATNIQAQPLPLNFDNTSDGTLPLDQTVAGMMNPDTFDLFAFSLTGRIVDDDNGFFRRGTLRQPVLTGRGDVLDISGSCIEKALKVVGRGVETAFGDFSGRVEFDQHDQSDQVAQEVLSLGFAQDPQENRKIGRNFFGNICSHGFRALLGLDSKGVFGWKPFYLKQLTSFVT